MRKLESYDGTFWPGNYTGMYWAPKPVGQMFPTEYDPVQDRYSEQEYVDDLKDKVKRIACPCFFNKVGGVECGTLFKLDTQVHIMTPNRSCRHDCDDIVMIPSEGSNQEANITLKELNLPSIMKNCCMHR